MRGLWRGRTFCSRSQPGCRLEQGRPRGLQWPVQLGNTVFQKANRNPWENMQGARWGLLLAKAGTPPEQEPQMGHVPC